MQLTIPELLDYFDEERTRWQRWFGEHGDAPLAFPLPGAYIPDVRALVQHTLGAPLWFIERLEGRPVTEWWKAPASSIAELFALGERASNEVRQFVASAKPEDWNAMLDHDGTGKHRATARKAVANSLIHAIRHWAQVALVVRQNGMAPPGDHDLIFSAALQ
ncbi:MAG TPA: DinB family protein [Bryobacteraceae bacterium]|nr:DinB family protein [Bryobacteraceae bacterium]